MAKVWGASNPESGLTRAKPSDAPDDSGPLMTLRDWAALASAAKVGDPPPAATPPNSASSGSAARAGPLRDIIGKAWNAPNTALGAIYGGLGMGAGALAHVFGGAPEPKVFWRDNAVQFTNNPFGGVSAITLGNTTTWRGDPYDPTDEIWHDNGVPMLEPPGDPNGHTYPVHETQHTVQGEQLGPLYLPSNVLGGLNAALRGEGWHGPHNWNEVGPQSPASTPWAVRR